MVLGTKVAFSSLIQCGECFTACYHPQLLAVTIRVIWLVGFPVEVILPSLVQ